MYVVYSDSLSIVCTTNMVTSTLLVEILVHASVLFVSIYHKHMAVSW